LTVLVTFHNRIRCFCSTESCATTTATAGVCGVWGSSTSAAMWTTAHPSGASALKGSSASRPVASAARAAAAPVSEHRHAVRPVLRTHAMHVVRAVDFEGRSSRLHTTVQGGRQEEHKHSGHSSAVDGACVPCAHQMRHPLSPACAACAARWHTPRPAGNRTCEHDVPA
jgi:hypothetical protein